jgi:hypothetical protein
LLLESEPFIKDASLVVADDKDVEGMQSQQS